jgi:hypothetical protein
LPLELKFDIRSPSRILENGFEENDAEGAQAGHEASVVAQKFVEQSKRSRQLESNSNPPCPPFDGAQDMLFQRGISPGGVNPSLTKRGRGDLYVACGGTYVANFRDSTLAEKLFQ